MRRFVFAYLIALLASPAIPAQFSLIGAGPGSLTLPVTYTGPGDVVASASVWWGLRAYTAAAAGSNAADILCVTATTTQTIKTLANGNLDVATLTTACPADTYHVSKLYDQTGGGKDLVQATDSKRPVLTLNCINTSLPCMTFDAAKVMSTASLASIATPFSYSAVAKRTGSFTNFQVILDTFLDGGSTGSSLLFANSTNTARWGSGNGATVTATAADSAWHAFQATSSAGSGTINVDNAGITTGAITNQATTNNAFIGQRNDAAIAFTGTETEMGIWPVAFSSTQQTNMCHNQFGYWATSVSC